MCLLINSYSYNGFPFCSEMGCICTCTKCRSKGDISFSTSNRRLSIKIVPESQYSIMGCNASILENYASNTTITYGADTIHDSVYQEKSIGEPLIVRANSLIHEPTPIINASVTAREIVLRRCGQTEPLSFEECYTPQTLQKCFKIGEGVYGEVFLFKNHNGTSSVMKIIPIEGKQMVNGEHQKKFEEVLSEIVIAMELSNLRNETKNKTYGFSEVQKIRCVQGRYPERLLELWDIYDETHHSENESPEMFTDDQLYIIFEFANAGTDMEAFVFNNALQAFALFKQTACSLAIAESALQFEHRDLHWGNILISQTDKNKKLTYCLDGHELTIPACGIVVTVIDFTLSRITHDGVCIYNDLSMDPDLFTATGDYQFEIYKLMQKHNNNEWQHFQPYSNVLWLHYVVDKMTSALRYKNTNSNVHKNAIKTLLQLKDRILQYNSAEDLVKNEFLL
ncbi:hypothetical protein ILUMI_07288 [Ignelater luminosus]|uniref:non-specific serine/threonine protein kinase n=1 Tax=Ignelater luminosus TaxID=2038154 RepID=A0A8K0GGG6_IGNLU|nr:hypothetical protein ILUMI_07288 [Ignelater luminosus]